jgi:hypothetical protein
VKSIACLSMILISTGFGLGCTSDDPRSSVELPQGDACGEVGFWASTASGDLAVQVSIDVADRATDSTTVTEFVLPDDAVQVQVLEGTNLPRNFCTDLIDSDSQPKRRRSATAGTGTITVEPRTPDGSNPVCGSAAGLLTLTGLVADDGTTFAPITVQTRSVGCYSG